MDMLVLAALVQKPHRYSFESRETEDQYYRSHAPKNRSYLFPIASLTAIAGFLALTLNLPLTLP